MLHDDVAGAARRHLLLLAVVALIGGCGSGTPPPSESAAGDRALLESAERPLQRAHEAEAVSGERKADLDQKLREAE
jgi:hypothetical protein